MLAAGSPDSKDEKRAVAGGASMIKAMQDYITRAISVPGMKAFVLDHETMAMVALVYSQTEIINREVFLTERLDQSAASATAAPAASTAVGSGGAAAAPQSGKMHHLKAVCFVRPDRANIDHFKQMLAKPKYKEYHIFFTNIVPEEYLRALAEADEFELIRQVQEYYGDYYAVNPNLWHVNLFDTRPLHELQGRWGAKQNRAFTRNVQGIVSSLLALKKRPVIRYSRNSELCHSVATAVAKTIRDENALFHFGGQASTPLLLVIDRRDDPVTPLLLQWTYQAMVHELLGLVNNRIDMSKAKDIRKELREVVLSCDADHFFRGAMYLNYGELGASIKDLVEQYQRKTKTHTKLESIADMQKFVENYPEFKQMSGNVSKHVALMTEMNRIVDSRDLMDISKLEQDLACTQDHSSALEQVLKVLEDAKCAFEDKLRVAALYALRYEAEAASVANVRAILRTKAHNDTDRARASAIDELLAYAGVKQRSGDLFGNKTFLSKASKFFSSGLQGVENVFAQHKPLLMETLDAVIKKQLKSQVYPFVDGKDATITTHAEVFVFVVGGVTYEEAMHVHQLNDSKENPQGIRFVLGGSCVHNSRSFLDDVLGWADKDDVRIHVHGHDAAAGGGATAAHGTGGSAGSGGSKKNKPYKFDG